jgi:outer membrane receptor for monomeric catechols
VIANFESAMADQFALEGEDVGGTRKHKVNLFTRYSFTSGRLRGAYIGGGYRHQSKNVAGRNGPRGEFIHGPSYWLADAVIGYRVPRFPHLRRVNFQLNIANLFDANRPLVTHYFDDGRVRRWFPLAPRTWRLSASCEL